MFALLVVWSAFCLLLSSVVLFAFGHRLRSGHWLLSLATILAIGALALVLQQALLGSAPPARETLTGALLAGALVTAAFERWNALGHAAFTAAALAAGLYVAFAGYILFAAHLGPWSLALGLVLFMLQFAAMALLVASTFEIVDVLCRWRWEHRVEARRVPGYAPKVSLHVPIHREPPEVVIETLDAISRLDYPDFEVLVIDNNTDDESLWRPVQAHCERLGPRFRFFHLMPWPGYKSGALNFGLEQTAPDAQIVGIVDADYQVEPNWLADLVGHFADSEVAFVQTPQDYRDIESRGLYGKALALSYIYFFRVSMASRNERNAIIFAGTMGLLRKSALEEAGGWDEWCITEDAELSLRLLNLGHRGIYVDKTYGRGIMPLDYAGLKKQRFRWAFGGMQILRMHADKLFNPLHKGGLTFAQRWCYVSGGLQWLNDPITLAFTMVLLIGSTTLLMTDSLAVQPFVGAVFFVPPIFLLFAIARFPWALRVREGTSLPEAMRALAVLLGLTWVVSLACLRGLVSRQGVFLRTPKQGGVACLSDTFAIVRWESVLGVLCLAAAALLLRDPPPLFSARSMVILLLLWQSTIYLSALLTSAWDYGERRGKVPWRIGFRTLGYAIGKSTTERPMALGVGLAVLVLGQIFFLAVMHQPPTEKLFRADPLHQFLPAASLIPPTLEERAAAVLVSEAAAAKTTDIDMALTLWAPDAVIVDENFTPGQPEDDRVWQGQRAVRERYVREFRERDYVSLQHLNLDIRVEGNRAVIMNDLDASIRHGPSGRLEQVKLPRSDRWELRESDGRWQIVKLEVNRTPRGAYLARQGGVGK
jgi:cellulose synthase/poly-beta-1,6-N-acetylglucosamine synthase-like glycosyltransferase/ketosteroid isomerase-like protein